MCNQDKIWSNISNLRSQIYLDNQHRVTIAIKAVFLFNGYFVSINYLLISAESAHHH